MHHYRRIGVCNIDTRNIGHAVDYSIHYKEYIYKFTKDSHWDLKPHTPQRVSLFLFFSIHEESISVEHDG